MRGVEGEREIWIERKRKIDRQRDRERGQREREEGRGREREEGREGWEGGREFVGTVRFCQQYYPHSLLLSSPQM